MGHALIASFGGIPLIYMGDEIALLNDYGYVDDPDHAHDSRWVHRPRMDWDAGGGGARPARARRRGSTPGVRHILARRRATPEFHAAHPTLIADTGQVGLFAFVRQAPTGALVCIFNFTEFWANLRHEWAWRAGRAGVPRRALGRGRGARRRAHPAAALRPALAAVSGSRSAAGIKSLILLDKSANVAQPAT